MPKIQGTTLQDDERKVPFDHLGLMRDSYGDQHTRRGTSRPAKLRPHKSPVFWQKNVSSR